MIKHNSRAREGSHLSLCLEIPIPAGSVVDGHLSHLPMPILLLSEYLFVAEARSASLQIMVDKVELASCTTVAAFKKSFEDALSLKRDTLMMWMSDADGNAIF